jgi:large subunit ribosomal protein L23Ae
MPKRNKMDKFTIVKHPHTSEESLKKIELHNTLVFICDVRANKHQIRQAVRELYEVESSRVNTLVRPDGQKKAFVRLKENYDALEIANKVYTSFIYSF